MITFFLSEDITCVAVTSLLFCECIICRSVSEWIDAKSVIIFSVLLYIIDMYIRLVSIIMEDCFFGVITYLAVSQPKLPFIMHMFPRPMKDYLVLSYG